MTKIGIIGVGRVGSSLAFSLLFHPKVTEIYLNDKNQNRCKGECEDLKQASLILNKPTRIKCMNYRDIGRKCDYIFIAAGFPRINSFETLGALIELNQRILDKLIKELPKDKIHIITNPSDLLGKYYAVKWLGRKLDATRKTYNMKDGGWILDRKGYTNWGITAEAWKVIK